MKIFLLLCVLKDRCLGIVNALSDLSLLRRSLPLRHQKILAIDAGAFGCHRGAMTTPGILMNTEPLRSPMLEAIDLIRVNIDALTLEELEAHAKAVLDVIGGLNGYLNSPSPKSANSATNALILSRKLLLHMARVRDLINAHKLAAAMLGSAQAAGAAKAAPAGKPIGC